MTEKLDFIIDDNDALADLPAELLEEGTGFDPGADEKDCAVQSTPAGITRAVSSPGFEKASDIIHRTYGTLFTTPYTSASGHFYPGRFYTVPDREIDGAILHHMANGDANITDATLNVVALRRTGSWTDTVMNDGEIIQWLPENVAPWTTSCYEADKNKLTVEIENCKGAPNWEISEKAKNSVIDLLADFAIRHPKIGLWRFDGTKAGSNIWLHEWFASTNCPGPYIKSIIPEIVAKANARVLELTKVLDDESGYSGVKRINGLLRLYEKGKAITKEGEHCVNGIWYYVKADGTVAAGEEITISYTFQGEDPAKAKTVRYDADGKMIKGWYTDAKGQSYLYDLISGARASGEKIGTMDISGASYKVACTFDSKTGKLLTVNPENWGKDKK